MDYDSREGTLAHITKVQRLLTTVATRVIDRGRTHDASKLEAPEKEYFDKFIPKLAHLEYGSQEYRDCLSQMRPAIEHHHQHNRHHPEFHLDGIWGMTLVDLIEMLCDWKAAGERHKDFPGDIRKSLQINFERHRIPQPIFRILMNTIDDWWPERG